MAGVAALLIVVAGTAGAVALSGRTAIAGQPIAVVEAKAPPSATSTSTTPPASTTTSTASKTTTSSTTSSAAAGASPAGRIEPGVPHTGVATFYDSDGGGACSYDPGPDPLTAAMNSTDFEGSQACGAYVLVQAAGGASLTVRITNLCPAPCRVGQLDLSAAAFARLAPPVAGEIPITWTLVSPALSKNISIRYKTGSTQWWCGIQVIDHRNPVARMEVQVGGQWQPLHRADYNYFLSESGAGCGKPIALTDIYGQRLVVAALPVKPDVLQATNVQFAGH